MNGRVAKEIEERKEVRRAPTKGKGKGKSETRRCYDCGEQGHVGVNCPYKWTNSIDEEDDHGSSWRK